MKLTPKPWNDPWTRDAMRQENYKAYCMGTRAARFVSWRRLTKAAHKVERGIPAAGRVERAVSRRGNPNEFDRLGEWHGRNA